MTKEQLANYNMTAEELAEWDSLEFITDDELLEVTPKSIRIRKRILDNQLRAKQRAKLK